MKVVYLTWGETPRLYGVFGSQVIGQFVETAKLLTNDEFHFMSAVPVVHSGFLREKWSYFRELSAVKEKLASIKFHWLPIFAPQNFVNSSKNNFALMHGLTHFCLKNKLKKVEPDIVHCRSYHAAWAALCVKRKYQFDYKIIFDGRGLWPEEVALKKRWETRSKHYLFLKSIELELLENCDSTVTVSDTMHNHYNKLGAKNDHTIYLSADTEKLKVDLENIKKSDTIRFCYVGALSEDTWHKPKALVDLYRRLRELLPKTQLTIVTTSSHIELRSQFSEFPVDELILASTKTREELKDIFEMQDFGLMTYFLPEVDNEVLLGDMVLAVKTAEYFVAGLPMICNAYCGGAARIIRDNELGIVYYPESLENIDKDSILGCLDLLVRKNCQEFSLKNFDYLVNAGRYKSLYLSLMVNK